MSVADGARDWFAELTRAEQGVVGFIVALTGDVLTMPGLPADSAAAHIEVDDDGEFRLRQGGVLRPHREGTFPGAGFEKLSEVYPVVRFVTLDWIEGGWWRDVDVEAHIPKLDCCGQKGTHLQRRHSPRGGG